MKFTFSEIDAGGLHKLIEDPGMLGGSGVDFLTKPKAEIFLKLVNEITATLEGDLQGVVDMHCSRCGQPVVFKMDTDYSYIFRFEEDGSLLKKDIECSEEDYDTVYLDEPIIDIGSILQEQLILSVPAKILCSEECKGLCHQCGAIFNNELCSCQVEETNSPFDILKKIKR